MFDTFIFLPTPYFPHCELQQPSSSSSFFIPEKELLRMVREVSEDRIYDTIEFNEFLQMLSKQQRNYTQDSLRDAFR